MKADHRPDWRAMIVGIGVVVLLVYSGLLWWFGVSKEVLVSVMLHLFVVATTGGLIWMLFERYGWATWLATPGVLHTTRPEG